MTDHLLPFLLALVDQAEASPDGRVEVEVSAWSEGAWGVQATVAVGDEVVDLVGVRDPERQEGER